MTTDLHALCADLIERLEWYVREDDTYEGDNTENGGINWDEENAYWINGRDEAIALITRARAALAPWGNLPTSTLP